jgi:hypothetical protein
MRLARASRRRSLLQAGRVIGSDLSNKYNSYLFAVGLMRIEFEYGNAGGCKGVEKMVVGR